MSDGLADRLAEMTPPDSAFTPIFVTDVNDLEAAAETAPQEEEQPKPEAESTASESGEMELPTFESGGGGAPASDLGLLDDVSLKVRVELGRTSM